MVKWQKDPPRDCPHCPRLVQYRHDIQAKEPSWFNAPVPSLGPAKAAFLIVGLAPGIRGANRTGRPFTGDYAGDLLYATLLKFGFASGRYDSEGADDLKLQNCRITNAVRCVPPQNKPVGAEINTCREFLTAEIKGNRHLKLILALGRIAHDTLLTTLGQRRAAFPFGHNARHQLAPDLVLYDSYHCSRYNTNTRRLTEAMFEAVFANIRDEISAI